MTCLDKGGCNYYVGIRDLTSDRSVWQLPNLFVSLNLYLMFLLLADCDIRVYELFVSVEEHEVGNTSVNG